MIPGHMRTGLLGGAGNRMEFNRSNDHHKGLTYLSAGKSALLESIGTLVAGLFEKDVNLFVLFGQRIGFKFGLPF